MQNQYIKDGAALVGWVTIGNTQHHTDQLHTLPEQSLIDAGITLYQPTTDQLLQEQLAHKTDLIKAHLNEIAQAYLYDNIDTACAYAAAPNPYQAESMLFVIWRGQVWATCAALLAAINAGTASIPTDAELVALLPIYPPI